MSMWCYRVGPEVLIGLTTVMLRYVMALKYALNRFSMLFSKPGQGAQVRPEFPLRVAATSGVSGFSMLVWVCIRPYARDLCLNRGGCWAARGVRTRLVPGSSRNTGVFQT